MVKLFKMKQLKKIYYSLVFYGKTFIYSFFMCLIYSIPMPKVEGEYYYIFSLLTIGVILLISSFFIDKRIKYRRKIGRERRLRLKNEEKEIA